MQTKMHKNPCDLDHAAVHEYCVDRDKNLATMLKTKLPALPQAVITRIITIVDSSGT